MKMHCWCLCRQLPPPLPGSFVTVVDEATGKQEKRQVTLGSQNLQFAEVLSGLKAGDKVVIEEKVTGAPIVTGFPAGVAGDRRRG